MCSWPFLIDQIPFWIICNQTHVLNIIEYKGGYYKTAYDEITKKVSKWENEAIELLKNGEYDKANKVYGEKLQNYFNNNEYNINMYKVELWTMIT